MTKTENGMEFPAEAYAYVGDPEKADTWKLRMWESPEKKATVAQLGRAAAAFSPGGFRGEKVEIPSEDAGRVKARIRAAYKACGAKPEDMPESIAASEGPFLVALSAVIGEGLVRIPLAKLGKWFKGKQQFSVTKADMAAMVANFRKRKNGEVPLDYDHGMVYAAGSGQPVPAAGWLKEIEDGPDADGVLYGSVEFTDKAREMVKAKEYKYISPVIVWGARDKVTGEQQGATVQSVALTNAPLMDEMPALAMSEGWVADDGATETRREKEPMVKKVVLADRAAGTVRLVAEDGTESVLSVEGLQPEPKVARLSEVKRGSDGRFDFTSLPQGKDVLIASDVLLGMQAQGELDAAVKAGKITPAQRPLYEKMALGDLAGFKTLVASMKPQVELAELGLGGGAEGLTDLQQVEGQIDSKVREKMAADKGLQYHHALKLVASENPDLDRRRTQLIREKVS